MNGGGRKGDGVWRIVRFNWPFYVVGLSVFGTAIFLAFLLNGWWRGAAILLGFGAAWGVFGSLLVSWWIYDLSPLRSLAWLHEICPKASHIVNIHAGYDDTSLAVRARYPDAELRVFDFYSPATPEPSIQRARRLYPPPVAAQSVSHAALPGEDDSANLVLLLLAAHELRAPSQRRKLLAECARLIGQQGRVVVAEHLRDGANFLAFGPGFLHFHSRYAWLADFKAAGLAIEREFKITPFIRAFVLRSQPHPGITRRS